MTRRNKRKEGMKISRIQFDLEKSRLEEIDLLVKKCGLSTRKDFFNNAVTLLKWAIEKKKKGCIIVSIDSDGEQRELDMPIFSAVTPI